MAIAPFGPMALAYWYQSDKALQMEAENEAARTGDVLAGKGFNPKTCKLHRNDTDAHTNT